METRDQWYKPNLLYNIHYRPPKKPEPPKMIVETVQFNPSVCTCGEHACQPQYRMEKRVLWTNKDTCNAKQQSEIKERENEDEHRENKFRKIITKQDRKISSVTESQQMGLKEEGCQERRCVEGDEGKQMGLKEDIGKKCCLKESDTSKQMFRRAFNEEESFEVQGDDDEDDGEDDGDEEEEEEKKEEWGFKNELGCSSDSKDSVYIDEEASNTNNIKENNSNGRSGRANSEGRSSEGVYGEKIIRNDSESVLSNNCESDEKSSIEDQIKKDHTTGEGDGTDDSDRAGDAAEYRSSEHTILINDETAQSYSLESENGGLEDEEIASAFGIMTIYCNSELHSWSSFKGEEDA